MQDTPEFDEAVRTICDVYRDAAEYHQADVHVVSVDEKTGIQALERKYRTIPAKPGKLQRREFEYIRHGTLCLIANFEIATGRVLAPSIGQTRTEFDFLAHSKQTVETAPDDEWIFVVDRLNTHMSETLVRWVADQCGIAADLGKKNSKGILKNQASRRAFLSDPSHRIRFVYTPTHASWLNQIEIWFSTLTARLLRRGSFKNIEHLRDRIQRFIDFFNATMAKPYKWTYTGKPLAA